MENELAQLVKQNKITNVTQNRVLIAKNYIEKKYHMKKQEELIKKKDWDLFNKKLEELKLSNEEKETIRKDVLHKEGEFLRLTRKKISIREFESLNIIGRGAFGEVRVCRHKESGDIVAVKKMRKQDMHTKNQIMHIRTEKEILQVAKSDWVVQLKYSFQDELFLYLVMEFLPGGDFMSLLMKKDILTEDECRYYIAQLILAIESIHKLNCIHRDLKPDNLLINKDGSIKLSDFGLSKMAENEFFPISANITNNNNTSDTNINNNNIPSKEDIAKRRKNRLLAYSTVGTPDYIAPEVFSQSGYGMEVDWWSVGVILFECLVGYPPFFSENPSDTCQRIIKWNKVFDIPADANLSTEANSLIRKLITYPDQRLGYKGGANEIKQHKFFNNFDWDNIKQIKAPFIPDIENDWDTKYFDKFNEEEPFYPPEKKSKKIRKDIAWINYTYNSDMDNLRCGIINALDVLESVKFNNDNLNNKEENNIERINTTVSNIDTINYDLNSKSKKDNQLKESINTIKDIAKSQAIINNSTNKKNDNNNINNNSSKKIIYINKNNDISSNLNKKNSLSNKNTTGINNKVASNVKINLYETNKEKTTKHIQTVNVNLNSVNIKEQKNISEKSILTIKSNISKNIVPLSTKNDSTKPKIFQNIQVNLKNNSPKSYLNKTNNKK